MEDLSGIRGARVLLAEDNEINQQVARKILKKFRAGNLGVMEKIREEVARKDLDQAERLVHGVKGASGNIGATELFESARILDDALKL